MRIFETVGQLKAAGFDKICDPDGTLDLAGLPETTEFLHHLGGYFNFLETPADITTMSDAMSLGGYYERPLCDWFNVLSTDYVTTGLCTNNAGGPSYYLTRHVYVLLLL